MNDTPSSPASKSEAVRILLVEDDDGSALLLQTSLARWRYGVFEIRRVGDLASAVRAVAQGGIDLVLLDLGLPDSQGLDTFVRMHAGAGRVPIIVLSGISDEVLAITTVQQGAQDYIPKEQTDSASLARGILHAIERCRIQHALAEERDLLRGLLDNIPDQVYMKDTESRFISVNSATARFFGVSSPDQVVGKSDFDFFPAGLAATFRAEEQALLCGNRPCVNREAVVTDFRGVLRWVLTTKVLLHDQTGNIIGLLGINRDITDRKEAEDAIRRLNAELELRVVERTNELRKALTHLEEHDRAQTEFIFNVSHDLKTPLASMHYGITNLLEGVAGPASVGMREYLHMLNTTCQRMAGTVEDILDFSRLENNTICLNRVKLSLDRRITRSLTALRAQAQIKNITLTLSLPPGLGFVACDALKTERVFVNIIGNAVNFTPEGGTVEIGLHGDPAVPGWLVVDVTDNGIGIAPQYLTRVTERYFRIGGQINGTGLGLSIAKDLVELHGGRLIILSPPPDRTQGTQVTIRLPAVVPPTLLVALDDESTRHFLEQLLRTNGYQVIVCDAGDEALELAHLRKPDVGIINGATVGVGQSDLVLKIKADPTLQAIPLVAIESASISSAREAILKALGIPLLPKLWREEDLFDRIEAGLNQSSLAAMPKPGAERSSP